MAEQHTEKKKNSRVHLIAALIVMVLGGGIVAFVYMLVSNKTVYIEKSQIAAPLVELSSVSDGILKTVFVYEGEIIPANTVVAQVGTELIKSTTGGLVVTVNNNIGKQIASNSPVVVIVDPAQLRVVGEVQEDKGFVDIHVGDVARFTVDAFGGKEFTGIVDSIAPISRNSDVVFSVSNKRQEKSFNIKVNYNAPAHPEIKNGMSAKMWVYKQ